MWTIEEVCEVCGAKDGEKHIARLHGANEEAAAAREAYVPEQD